MRRHLLIFSMIFVAIALMLSVPAYAQQGYGNAGQGPDPGYRNDGRDWFCPWCGRGGYGTMGRDYPSGPMHWGRGGGMMGPGYGGRHMYRDWRGDEGAYRDYGRGGMGPGMMHRGYDRGPRHGYDYAPRRDLERDPLDKKEAENLVRNYLRYTRNPNLKVGDIEDAESIFKAEIVTRDGSLVDELEIDKSTGWMRPANR